MTRIRFSAECRVRLEGLFRIVGPETSDEASRERPGRDGALARSAPRSAVQSGRESHVGRDLFRPLPRGRGRRSAASLSGRKSQQESGGAFNRTWQTEFMNDYERI